MLKDSNFEMLIAYEMEFEFLENMINDPILQELFRSKNHYDLVIAELFVSEAFFALGNKFHAPVISVTSQTLFSYHKWILDIPNPYFPNSFLEENVPFVSRAINIGWNFILSKN